MDKKQIVIVLPDESEIFDEVTAFTRNNPDWYGQMHRAAERAVAKSGRTTDRYNPQPVRVQIFTLGISDGKLTRSGGFFRDITPPLRRMTEEEYRTEMDEILATLPEEFRSYVEGESWDSGHAAGNEEVVSYARSMSHALQEPIKKYTERIKTKK